MPDFQLVDDYRSILPVIQNSSDLGVDTEFLREKTFLSQLCLIQVSAGDKIYCVDPLNGQTYDIFWESICEPRWIVHSARQDIEVIYQSSGRMPAALFDTQIAAGLLGYAPQMGYGGLVEELFDVQLPKSHTRADWSKRPLAGELLEYAAEDVEYLLPAYEILAGKLDKSGRLDWAVQDSALLLEPELYEIRPNEAINRVKGARNLRGRRRVAAAGLAAWREQQALERNRPRQWILRDSVLLNLAFKLPENLSALRKIEQMPNKLADRAGRHLLQLIAESKNDDGGYQPPRPPDEEQKRLLKDMQQVVAACADDLGVAAETVASKKELSAAILLGEFTSRVFNGWRRELIGDDLLKLC